MKVGKHDLIANLKNPARTCWRDKVEAVDEIVRLRKALFSIAMHPHNRYDHEDSEQHDLQYSTGVTDGHRCAATLARAALGESDESDTIDESLADA